MNSQSKFLSLMKVGKPPAVKGEDVAHKRFSLLKVKMERLSFAISAVKFLRVVGRLVAMPPGSIQDKAKPIVTRLGGERSDHLRDGS